MPWLVSSSTQKVLGTLQYPETNQVLSQEFLIYLQFEICLITGLEIMTINWTGKLMKDVSALNVRNVI
jgi:hypothetical protein